MDLLINKDLRQAFRAERQANGRNVMAKKKEKRGSWIVTMRCVITKEVYLEDCTEEQAGSIDCWDHAVDENEVDQIDWEIQSVKAND
jgi:hypothetical protein